MTEEEIREESYTSRKNDTGKNRVGLFISDFALSLLEVAKITTYGCAKYAPRSWRGVPDAEERYRDALYRHLVADETGEDVDEESGLLHLAHAAWNILALIWFKLEKGRR